MVRGRSRFYNGFEPLIRSVTKWRVVLEWSSPNRKPIAIKISDITIGPNTKECGKFMLQEILTASIAFIVTNVDDFVVLMVLFLQAPNLWRETIAGQYIGFGILVLLSLPGFWLGQLPIKPWIGVLGLIPIALGIRAWLSPDSDSDSDFSTPPKRLNFFHGSPQIGLVASLTIANGGDNIAIYTSLFSRLTPVTLALTLFIWSIQILLWCVMARYFARKSRVQKLVKKYGQVIVPIVLISLGFYIIMTAFV